MTDRAPSFRAAREALLADHDLRGSAWSRACADAADAWLVGLLAQATGGDESGIALVAVGGYGRAELAPGSDIDLVLVHDRRKIREIADALWYPIWDDGVRLDHSVRTVKEVRAAMDGDIKVALGLLDGRLVAGDARLAATVLERGLDLWRTRVSRWLPTIDELTRERHGRSGDVAFLLEPDLKESRGGRRDISLLRSLGRVVPVLAGVLDDPSLTGAAEVLDAARVEVQRQTGTASNTLLLQEQDGVAAALRYADADALMAAVAEAGRTISWTNDDGWRRLQSWLAGPRGRSPGRDVAVEPGVVLREGEIVVATDARFAEDTTLGLRVAAASAELDKPMARGTLDRLATEAVAPTGVWPPEALHALLRLLGTGFPAIPAVEALDQQGVWLRYLPEWAPVRNRPQRNAYHRYTVDRHLLETVAHAAGLLHKVARPDLLLLGALLHDIGKGRVEDHSEVGIRIVGQMGPRIGLPDHDVATLQKVVELHLLLPETATRRDIDDPATAATVAAAVGDLDTLELLAALCEADGQATGSAAWGPWKARMIARLVERTTGALEGRPPPGPDRAELTKAEQALVGALRLQVVADGSHLTVAAPDRAGLLATVAGVLSLSSVTVRSATTVSDETSGMAILRFDVVAAEDRLPEWDVVAERIDAALDGRLALDEALAERERHQSRFRRPTSAQAPAGVRVTVDNAASVAATLLEVRAPDRGALLYRLARSLAGASVTITVALVSTLGVEAIDVFYVQTLDRAQFTDPAHVERLKATITAAV